jgi:hypothetical protein
MATRSVGQAGRARTGSFAPGAGSVAITLRRGGLL